MSKMEKDGVDLVKPASRAPRAVACVDKQMSKEMTLKAPLFHIRGYERKEEGRRKGDGRVDEDERKPELCF